MLLHYTETGYLIMLPYQNPRRIIDAMLETGYSEEFCVSLDFRPDFIARLMAAGFLVMSTKVDNATDEAPAADPKSTAPDPDEQYILLPKLHLTRSALFFDRLHIKKSVRRYLDHYELRPDADFDFIVNRCQEIHGEDWLTRPLIAAIRNIRQRRLQGVYPMSFALYRNGKLAAGEFGVKVGRVYTSYSGYYDENNAGTVQLILTTRWLRENGFDFFDLGMPMDYKTALGAADISPKDFIALFRAAQCCQGNTLTQDNAAP
ncbi:MAG: GNAT family N-acetyltransferase [Treponema sp.]|jgi:Leu/Phe-tRNA-protein transferase|nr:GNAT family N-acetyltransferase [Treponema sp.]